ncbi:MAG: DUF4832 domain-containing protein [Pirellula sp.]|jgi:hypothetical protein
MNRRPFFATFLISLLTVSNSCFAQTFQLARGVTHAENPLKGLVPYANPAPNRFPHSMEFNYLPLSALNTGPKQYDWSAMESLLNDIASRGNMAVVRIYLEYPGKKNSIPRYLLETGLKTETYENTNTAPFPATEVTTPDYESPLLRTALTDFISEFGRRYDGDPRLGFVTAGLLGTWGEWHTYPRNDLWASKETQSLVMDAYEKAFVVTPVLLRYPVGSDHYDKAPNHNRLFGYHDDSLCWATLDTGRKDDAWFFLPALKTAGAEALNKWKTHPIGGEIRPEVWGKIFDEEIGIPQAQSFDQCASAIHLSWTMDTGMFREKASNERLKRALESVRKIGYDFYANEVKTEWYKKERKMEIQVSILNQGIAPFYYDWPLELSLRKQDGQIVKSWIAEGWSLKGQLPSITPKVRAATLDASSIPNGRYTVLLRAVNPLENGKPLRFANESQDLNAEGFLTLCRVNLD